MATRSKSGRKPSGGKSQAAPQSKSVRLDSPRPTREEIEDFPRDLAVERGVPAEVILATGPPYTLENCHAAATIYLHAQGKRFSHQPMAWASVDPERLKDAIKKRRENGEPPQILDRELDALETVLCENVPGYSTTWELPPVRYNDPAERDVAAAEEEIREYFKSVPPDDSGEYEVPYESLRDTLLETHYWAPIDQAMRRMVSVGSLQLIFHHAYSSGSVGGLPLPSSSAQPYLIYKPATKNVRATAKLFDDEASSGSNWRPEPPAAGEPISQILSPAQLSKSFGVPSNQVVAMIRNGTIRAIRHSSKQYQVELRALPGTQSKST